MPTSVIKAIGCKPGPVEVEYVTRSGKLYSEAVSGYPVGRVAGVGMPDDREGAKQVLLALRETREAAGKKPLKGTEVWHFVQSFDPAVFDETKAEDVQKASALGLELAKRLSERYNRPVFMATHSDAKGGHVHNHFLLARTGLDGKALHTDAALLEVTKELNDEVMTEAGIQQDRAIDRAPEKWRKHDGILPQDYVKKQVKAAVWDAQSKALELTVAPWDKDKKRTFEDTPDAKAFDQLLAEHNLEVYRWRKNRIGFRIRDQKKAEADGVDWTYTTADGVIHTRSDHYSDRTLGSAYSAESVAKVVSGTLTLESLQKASEAQNLAHRAKRSGIRSSARLAAESRQKRVRDLQRGWVRPQKPLTGSQKAVKRRQVQRDQADAVEALQALERAKVSDSVRKAAAALVAAGADVGAALKQAQAEEARSRQTWRGLDR